ncbi:hypothetical protein A7X12_14295 [Sphingomonas sp. TDK1]|nr:hypothetical protein A7X12_14295 [Sphingomonas sp. TDK1]
MLDQLLAGGDAATAPQQADLLDALKKALAERALNAEMNHRLAGEDGGGNTRNGYGRKTAMTDTGSLAIAVPRPPGELRSAADRQISAAVSRLRRQDCVDVRTGDEHAAEKAAPATS